MNKNQTELIKYAIMPRHGMETALVNYDCYKFRKTLKLFLANAGCSCFDASYLESPSGIFTNQQTMLIVSKEDSEKELKEDVINISLEILN